jgi:hypothetical protein
MGEIERRLLLLCTPCISNLYDSSLVIHELLITKPIEDSLATYSNLINSST